MGQVSYRRSRWSLHASESSMSLHASFSSLSCLALVSTKSRRSLLEQTKERMSVFHPFAGLAVIIFCF